MNKLENVQALRDLVDTFSILADKKAVQDQTLLFTEDAEVCSYLNGSLVSSLKGREEIGTAFAAFLDQFDIVYHFNGQHKVTITGDSAEGILYCLVYLYGKNEDGSRVKTTSGVTYQDNYVCKDGNWLIAKRTSSFEWQEVQQLGE